MKADELVRLIQDLDRGDLVGTDSQMEYLDLMRWKDGSGTSDEAATALVRQLAREALGGFELQEIGAATLRSIDEKGKSA